MSELPEYKIERIFDAPRELVWRAWTDPALLHRWYGPNVETTIHQFNLKAGGEWHNEMQWGDTRDYSKMAFQEVIEPERIVWHHSSTDADWNIITNPMMPNWPRVLLTTVTFEESDGKTTVRLTQKPLNATEAEIACFAGAMANMDHGWGAGFTILETMFAELQA